MLPDTGVQSEDPAQIHAVVRVLRAYRPQVALIPNPDDPHPDHAAGGILVQRALFLANVNGYATEADGLRQERWKTGTALVYSGRREVRPDVVVDVTDAYEVKLRSIRAHASQLGAGAASLPTPLTDSRFFDVIQSRAVIAGRRIGATYGEAFSLLAPIALRDLGSLATPEP
jgi:LmbE family N-acetylglucosaminyl deacetylase